MEKKWQILQGRPDKEAALQASLGISQTLCKILVQRGIETFDQARHFFRPQLSDLHHPRLMKDMDLATDRIRQAFSRQEKILVFGDYDVDGTTSVALLVMFLQKIYKPQLVDFYIPHRYREGYGLSRSGIDFAAENGFSLVIAVDCGIKSVDLVEFGRSLQIDFIICDHHLPDPQLPPAIAILNPKQPDCPYPYKELCGCGIAFKLATAISNQLELGTDAVNIYLDLVATAIAADIVPITGENRILAFFGLKKANENPNHGIRALARLSGAAKDLQIGGLLFLIAPRINAAGRMDDARKAVELFIAPELEQSLHYARMLQADNEDRKEADEQITQEALQMIDNDPVQAERKSTVVFQPHWHKGVVGIVASRLIEKYYRPTVVLTSSGEFVAGSARSVAGFNLYEAIHSCRAHLLGYGGHYAAAGMTLLAKDVEAFGRQFEAEVSATITPEQLVPRIIIDAEIRFGALSQAFHDIIRQMEPFGPENARPIFVSRAVIDTGYSKIVKDKHIRFSLRQDETTFNGIGFHLADKFSLLQQGQPIDLVYTLEENYWNGEKHLQLKVIDFR